MHALRQPLHEVRGEGGSSVQKVSGSGSSQLHGHIVVRLARLQDRDAHREMQLGQTEPRSAPHRSPRRSRCAPLCAESGSTCVAGAAKRGLGTRRVDARGRTARGPDQPSDGRERLFRYARSPHHSGRAASPSTASGAAAISPARWTPLIPWVKRGREAHRPRWRTVRCSRRRGHAIGSGGERWLGRAAGKDDLRETMSAFDRPVLPDPHAG